LDRAEPRRRAGRDDSGARRPRGPVAGASPDRYRDSGRSALFCFGRRAERDPPSLPDVAPRAGVRRRRLVSSDAGRTVSSAEITMERYPYVLDLFSGAGGFSLGAHLAGFSTAVAIELDGDLSASYRDNFPNAKLIRADITTLDPIGVLRHAGFLPADVRGILGGPP